MAETYRVCYEGDYVDTSVTMTQGSCQSRTYNSGLCTVTDKTRILTFTSTQVSDEDFRIWYNYTVTYTTNGTVTTGPVTVRDYVTMPAGTTSITKEVLCERDQLCQGEKPSVE